MTFSTQIARLNTACMSVLSDVLATVNGVPDVPGIFDAEYYSPLDAMEGSKPVLQVLDADAVGVKRGTVVVVNSVSYAVTKPAPDRKGWTVLYLERT